MYPLSMETFGEDWNESQFWVCRFLCSTALPRRTGCEMHDKESALLMRAWWPTYSTQTRRRTSSHGSSWTGPRPRLASQWCLRRASLLRSRTFL